MLTGWQRQARGALGEPAPLRRACLEAERRFLQPSRKSPSRACPGSNVRPDLAAQGPEAFVCPVVFPDFKQTREDPSRTLKQDAIRVRALLRPVSVPAITPAGTCLLRGSSLIAMRSKALLPVAATDACMLQNLVTVRGQRSPPGVGTAAEEPPFPADSRREDWEARSFPDSLPVGLRSGVLGF